MAIYSIHARSFRFGTFRIASLLALCLVTLMASLPAFAAPLPQTAQSSPTSISVISIRAKKYEFIPAEITLKKGQTVKLVLTSDDVRHSLVVKALGINGDMKKGKDTEVIVTPDTTGNFPGKCGHFCGTGHGKMHFMVHVVNP